MTSLPAQTDLDRLEATGLIVEVPEIVVHTTHQPDSVAHLSEPDVLSGEHDTELDFPTVPTEAAPGDSCHPVVQGIVELAETLKFWLFVTRS